MSKKNTTKKTTKTKSADADLVPMSEIAKEAKAKKAKKVSGLDAAYQVLAAAGEPMHCGDVVKKMLDDGMWKTGGKTPASTIYSAIVREITTKGADARFKKTDRGLFTVNA